MAALEQRGGSGITISDVARAAGVSKATASVALSGRGGVPVAVETRRRVREAADRLGYRRSGLAAALSLGRIYTVGLVSQVAATQDESNWIDPYQKDVLMAVACAAARAGLRLTTILARTPGGLTADEVADGRVDGVLLASVRDDELARALFAAQFPTVTLGAGYSERRVAPDNRGGVRSAVEHLAGLGHRRLAYVEYGSEATRNSFTGAERKAAFRESVAALGLPGAPRLLHQANFQAALAEPPGVRPTALVCFNDDIALGVLRHARRTGLRVPEDLSVTGFDDCIQAQDADPQLTTVQNPLDTQAEAAIALLQALWSRSRDAAAPPPIATRLIVRDSTAAAPDIDAEN